MVLDLLKGKAETVAEAKAKMDLQRQQLAEQQPELMPKMQSSQKPMDPERTRRHMSDMERLLGRINREMESLGFEPSR
jgi:hypothetical protein